MKFSLEDPKTADWSIVALSVLILFTLLCTDFILSTIGYIFGFIFGNQVANVIMGIIVAIALAFVIAEAIRQLIRLFKWLIEPLREE